MERGHWFWVAWFGVFVVVEAIGVFTKFPTLSNTWWTITDRLPKWGDIALTATMGGTLAWLLGVHWIGRRWDPRGFDWIEGSVISLGTLWAAWAALRRRRATLRGRDRTT